MTDGNSVDETELDLAHCERLKSSGVSEVLFTWVKTEHDRGTESHAIIAAYAEFTLINLCKMTVIFGERESGEGLKKALVEISNHIPEMCETMWDQCHGSQPVEPAQETPADG